MTPEDYSRARALFDKAMDLPPAERRAFVDRNTPPEDPLREELLAMVDAGDDTRFLATAARSTVLEDTASGGRGPLFQVGNYKILRELGRGGMGVVYLALRNDDVFHKIVALKVIGDGRGASEANFVQRFKQERQILAGLDHPNIARLLDGGNTSDGRPFYVMEYVAGSPIDEYCSRISADVPARVRMITEVCAAVEYLHSHAIAHRDIKPNNILVTPEGRVKLVDFGVAKVDTVDGLVDSPSLPGQPTMIMTPGYASPEQIAGDQAGKSGDIYSLGVVLYQLLTGRLPYADPDGRPNLAAQLSGADPKPPSKELTTGAKTAFRGTESRRASSLDLDRVVLTALQRDPLRRYSSVQLFAEDLRRCLDGRPIVARPESWAYQFRKLVSRNRVAASLAALLVVSAGVGTWMAVSVRIERAQIEAKEAELERFVALLNARVVRWLEPEQAGLVAEKVADVQAANRLMASDDLRTLSARIPDPERLKRLVADLRRFLDRAEELSRGLPPVRKEIALVYRQIGDFESTTQRVQITDKTQAAASYRRAASVAASIRAIEPSWAETQLSQLGGRLQELGSTLDVSLEQPPAPRSPETAAASAAKAVVNQPQPKAQTANGEPAAVPAAQPDSEEKAELVQRLKTTIDSAERARRNLTTLRDTLAGRGQAIRPDLPASMSQVDSFIEDARNSLNSNDLPAAEDALRRAGYELKKLFQSVGG
jgi:serine/threonine protein kinase